MMDAFEIRPYQGAGPINLGMTAREVERVLGSAVKSARSRSGTLEEYRKGVKVSYSSEGRVNNIDIIPPARALYKGIDLLAVEDPVSQLVPDDPEPLAELGIVLFLGLGLALNAPGSDPSEKGISVFQKGSWDAQKMRLRPLRPPATS
jgi:hypothetical protein